MLTSPENPCSLCGGTEFFAVEEGDNACPECGNPEMTEFFEMIDFKVGGTE